MKTERSTSLKIATAALIITLAGCATAALGQVETLDLKEALAAVPNRPTPVECGVDVTWETFGDVAIDVDVALTESADLHAKDDLYGSLRELDGADVALARLRAALECEDDTSLGELLREATRALGATGDAIEAGNAHHGQRALKALRAAVEQLALEIE